MEYYLNDLLYKTNSSDIHTLLLKPIYHITSKYPELITDLIQNETVNNSKAYDNLSKAYICMQDIVVHVNDIQRKYELSKNQ